MTAAAIAKELVRRFDITVAYLRSFFDEPAKPGKASMVRLCSILTAIAAIERSNDVVRFAFALPHEVAALGIVAGLPALFLTGACIKFLLRTRADQSTEPDDAAPAAGDDHR